MFEPLRFVEVIVILLAVFCLYGLILRHMEGSCAQRALVNLRSLVGLEGKSIMGDDVASFVGCVFLVGIF